MTAAFSEEEPLKFKIREKANDILADLILCAGNPVKIAPADKKRTIENILRNIAVIKGYFKVAESQEWIDPRNFLVLEEEYNRIKGEIEDQDQEPKKEDHSSEKPHIEKIVVLENTEQESNELSDRQEKVLQLLKQQDEMRVGELIKNFTNVSKRTLQRDLEILTAKGFINRNGKHNGIFYQFKGVTRV